MLDLRLPIYSCFYTHIPLAYGNLFRVVLQIKSYLNCNFLKLEDESRRKQSEWPDSVTCDSRVACLLLFFAVLLA